ncbi:MAG TPA: protein phosphatase 2C domain-containing protein [Chloroflexota bacterium]|nr:protein phosphatase 2C domain-containing protein [Chloroflexota bacterium]
MMVEQHQFEVSIRADVGNSAHPIQDNNDYAVFEVRGEVVGFFVVADGMGGYEDGVRASQTVIDTVLAYLEAHLGTGAPTTILRQAIEAANTAVHTYTQAEEIRSGSTITCALIHQGQAVIANVGDSRTYRRRQHQLQQITRDHSFVEELIQRNLMPAEERYGSRHGNILTRGLGTAPDVDIDFFELPLLPDDLLLLCSDGLSSTLREEEIAHILNQDASLDEISEQLVEAAIMAGGKDHITVMLVRL